MKLFLILIPMLLLVACSPKVQIVKVAPIEVDRPIIQYNAPPKQVLAPVAWDFPRSSTQVTIKNSKSCIAIAKDQGLDTHAVYDVDELRPRCAIPAIDAGSNLYIGLTEANFRNIVNNTNTLMMREQRWKLLLDTINTSLNPVKGEKDESKNSKE